MTTNKSKCCGADVVLNNASVFETRYYICKKCEEACDLAPFLRDSKEVLEFVEKEIEELNNVPTNYVRKRLITQAEKIKKFIEGK